MRTGIVILVICLFFGAVLVISMSQTRTHSVSQTHTLWDDEVIESTGQFSLSNNMELNVTVTDNNIVSFTLRKNGRNLVVSEEEASAYHNYKLLWEAQHQRLWFNSSDVGSTVYIPDTNGTYIAHYVTKFTYYDFDKPLMSTEDVPPHIKYKLGLR